MKEDAKMKENISNVPLGTMPTVGAMQQMQAAPNVSPMPNIPQSHMGVMPSMMQQVPMICCPFLTNMQCPMPFGPNVMGMAGNAMPAMNAMPGMNTMPAMNVMPEMNAMPGMGVLPTTNQFYPMGGM